MPIFPTRPLGAFFLFPVRLGVVLNCILFTGDLSLRLHTGVLECYKHWDRLRDESDVLAQVRYYLFPLLSVSFDV
jgi:hypothetical protein